MARRSVPLNRCSAAALIALLLLSGCSSRNHEVESLWTERLSPMDEYRLSVSTAQDVLAPYETLTQMIGFAGTHPDRCVPVTAISVICVWSLDRPGAGWQALAAIMGEKWMINLLCEFPLDDTARAPNSCSAHRNVSNRGYWNRRGYTTVWNARYSEDLRLISNDARDLLDGATTAFQLSTVVGDAPQVCVPANQYMLCTWETNKFKYGHGTLAVIAGTGLHAQARLNCTLPSDGAPRVSALCSASIRD